MNHIVFISHDATRTGAPIVLLHLLRQLKKQQACSFSVLLLNGGELEEEFRSVATTYVWTLQPRPEVAWKRYVRRLLRTDPAAAQRQHEQAILAALRKKQVNLVYGNTVVSSELAVRLKKELTCPAVCHVHELEIAIERYFGTARFGAQLPQLDLIIAASEAVRDNITTTYTFPVERITKVYEFVPGANEVTQELDPTSIRQVLDIPPTSLVVAASGTLDWRKSPDLFVQLASHVGRLINDMPYFLWVGGDNSSLAWNELQYDLHRLGIAKYVKFIGAQPNPLDYLRLADVFVLTSREDPYPLVCLEAATLSKPVVCFAQSGGMPEFVEDDCGAVVPFLRIDKMAQAVQHLLMDPDIRQQLGSNALHKVRAQHSVEASANQIMEQLAPLLRKHNS